MPRPLIALSCVACVLSAHIASAEDYVLSLEGTGLREYYCQIHVTLENRSGSDLTEISGYFYNFIGSEQVGRSKGTWFLNVPAGATVTSTFETPNAPCNTVERYDFVVGACRFDISFVDKSACAALIRGESSIVVRGRDAY